MKYKLFQPGVLRVCQIGMSCLMERDWLYSKFRKYLDWRISHNLVPNGLFLKTLHDGILNILGSTFFDQIFNINDDVLICNANDAFERSSEVLFLLKGSGCIDSEPLFELLMAIDRVDGLLMETPQKQVDREFRRKGIHLGLWNALFAVNEHYQSDINELRNMYAKNFAERVLHDRQLSEYISFSITNMYEEKGFPTLDSNGQLIIGLVKRQKWPSWVFRTLQARDRDKCANCGTNFIELNAEPQIDHIVPLSQGGCNDIVNLQLLCSKCNLHKLDKGQLVNSSIPEYLNWYRKMRLKG